MKQKIAVMTVNDAVWNLPLWARAVPMLVTAGYDVAGIWTCDDRLKDMEGRDIHAWYRALFGYSDFFLLTLFSVLVRLARLLALRPTDFKQLAQKHGLPHAHTGNPNDPAFVQWLKDHEIDTLLITVPHILQKETLSAVKTRVINQHEALLPAHRGLSPYIWAFLSGDEQGVTFHKVTDKIDAGKILYQEEIPDPGSLVGFHIDASSGYGARLLKTLSGAPFHPANLAPSCHGLPTPGDAARFRARGGRFIRLSDFFRISKLL